MSLMTHPELLLARNQGILRVPTDNPEPFNVVPEAHINAASIDVRLGRVFYEEDFDRGSRVRLAHKEQPAMIRRELDWGQEFSLLPGQFILAQTVEEFYLPNHVAAEFRLKSSVARAGLDQALAVWCDPGWSGSVLTVELRNNNQANVLVLEVGMKIGQVVFFRGLDVGIEASYAARGQYNNDKEAMPNKGVR